MIRQRSWNGKVARELRLRHELSPEELAERLGTHRSTVYAWESGQSPQMRHAAALADLYEVPLDAFFTLERASTTGAKGDANGSPNASAVSAD